MPARPHLRVVNTDGIATNTKVLSPDGKELKGVTRVELDMEVGQPVKATVHYLKVGGEVDAYIEQLRETEIPKPLPSPYVKLTIFPAKRRWWGGERCRYTIERWQPLPSWGMQIDQIAKGTMDVPPIQLPADFIL